MSSRKKKSLAKNRPSRPWRPYRKDIDFTPDGSSGITFVQTSGLGDALKGPGPKWVVLTVNADMSEADLVTMMREYDRSAAGLALLSVQGWDDDPRALWQIPECMELFRRMERVGFLGIISPNVPGDPGYEPMLGIGSVVVYGWLRGQGRQIDVERADYAEWLKRQVFLSWENVGSYDGQNRTQSGVPE